MYWLAFGDCGDYYCDSEHFLGMFITEEEAKETGEAYRRIGGLHRGTPNPVRSYSIGEYMLGERNSDHFS